MANPNTTYHPLGDYIRPVDVRNRDLKVTKLLGLSVSKEFMPSIANTIGTDMSTYKIVDTNQFVYIADTSRRGDKIAIALWTQPEKAIVSSIYTVFEIVDRVQLLPEYLMMWFRRPEFDRYARYHSHGSAREIFDWDEMCATKIPVPPIAEQRAIVAEYEAVQNRIKVAKRMIAALQATAQALYRKMFVDGIDKENLPEGWRWGTLGEVCEINPKLSVLKNVEIPYIDMDGLSTNGFSFNKIQNRIFTSGMKFQNDDVLFARISPCMENGKAAIVSGLKKNEIAYGSTEFIVLRGKQQKLTAILATLVRQDEFRSFAKKQMKGSDGRQRVEANSLYK